MREKRYIYKGGEEGRAKLGRKAWNESYKWRAVIIYTMGNSCKSNIQRLEYYRESYTIGVKRKSGGAKNT